MQRAIHVNNFRSILGAIVKSTWFFPVLLGLCFLTLTSFRISGTSVGVYHQFFYGNTKDPDLLYGHPQGIRSDEWLVGTQLVIAQAKSNFPRVNTNIGSTGRDMSVDIDVPYRDWSMVFKPQNLSFFILPLEYAFAFKWWLLLYLLILSVYLFVLKLFPTRRLMASLISLSFGFSPFVFWWYQSITLLPLAYGFFLILLGMRIIDKDRLSFYGPKRSIELSSKLSLLLTSLALTYVTVCFGLLLYPAFQVPVGITVAFFLLGYLLKQSDGSRSAYWKGFGKNAFILALPVLLAGLIVFIFLFTRQGPVSEITHTVYPGARVVTSGGYPIDRLLATYLQPQLQRSVQGAHYYTNQSESSNFILLLPYLLIPGLFLTTYEMKLKRKPDWLFISMHVVSLIFLLNLFVPYFQPIARLLVLTQVPHERLAIGLGMVGLIYFLLIAKKQSVLKLSLKKEITISAIYSTLCLILLLLVGIYTHRHFPAFIGNKLAIVGLALVFTSIIFFLIVKKVYIAASLLLVFSFFSVYKIHPLYRGLGPLLHNQISAYIDKSPQNSVWATLDDDLTENFAVVGNRRSLSGVQFYPDVKFWRAVEGRSGDDIYNRYARVIFSANPTMPPLQLLHPDAFAVRFSCDNFNTKHLDYILSEQRLSFSCLQPPTEIHYPNNTFFIYALKK